jgi:hypothetical protein
VTDSLPLLLVAGFILLGFVAMSAVILVVMIRTVSRVGRHGGIAGALYDGRVAHTYGELEAAPRGIAKVRLKVVGVEREAPAVGLEIHVNARLGYNMRAVRLTPDEALRVAEALEAVARR